jgi:hypothetical protein
MKNTEEKGKKRNLLYLPLIPVLLIIGGLGYSYYELYTDSKDDYMFDIGEEVFKIADETNCDVNTTFYNGLLTWKDSDSFFYKVIDANEINISPLDNESNEYEDFFYTLSAEIDKIMKENGFEENEINSVRAGCVTKMLNAYEKGNTRCLFKEIDDWGALESDEYFLTLSCAEIDFDNYEFEDEKEILTDLDKYDELITEKTIENNYAEIILNDGNSCGGYYVLAVKIEGKWVKIYEGQDSPTCKLIAQYDFPVSIVNQCIDESGNIVDR